MEVSSVLNIGPIKTLSWKKKGSTNQKSKQQRAGAKGGKKATLCLFNQKQKQFEKFPNLLSYPDKQMLCRWLPEVDKHAPPFHGVNLG